MSVLRNVTCTALFLAAAVAIVEPQAAQTQLERQTWTVDGVERTALVRVPRGDAPEDGFPLVFVFHGHGGNSRQAARSFRIHTHWPEAVVVYPQGLLTPGQLTDPEGRRPGWQHLVGEQNDRDLKFFDAMLERAVTTLEVDRRRTYAAGHSNGGSMTYVLWASRPDVFAAFAPSSSVFLRNMPGAPPKPAFIVAGEQDALVRFPMQRRSLDAVLRLNRADRTGVPWPDGEAATLHHSAIGADVVAYVHPGGHRLPADSGALMVKFFKAYTLAVGSRSAKARPDPLANRR